MTLLPAPLQADAAAEGQDPIALDLHPGVDERETSSFQEAEMASDAPFAEPTDDEIALEAYSRYLSRGAQDGHALEDWLEAERALRDRYSAAMLQH
jgi:hypothetical protein